MGEHNVDNPLYDMGNAVVELYKVADMAEIIIEAIFNGDGVTLQAVGNSMDVFLSQLRERIVMVEMLNEAISSRFSWVYDAQGGDSDRYCTLAFEEYISRRREPEELGRCGNMPAFVKLLPAGQRERIGNLLKETAVASRKRGFIEGYKAAVERCAGKGGEDGDGA